MRGLLSYILAHIGLIILGIATILSIVAVCSPHWSEGTGETKSGNEKESRHIFLGLWRTCASFDYEYFFFYKLNSWTHCIDSHGSDTAPDDSQNAKDSIKAAAATSLLGFLFLVIAVFIGIPYMFFFFRPAGRWLLLGACISTALGVIFHIIGLCVWGTIAHNNVAGFWGREPFSFSVTDLYWGWSFILAIIGTILAFIAFVLLLIAFIFHRPSEIFKFSSTKYVHKDKRIIDGKEYYGDSRDYGSHIRY